MSEHEFTRLYVMLRPARGASCGYARIEAQGARVRVNLRLSQLPQGTPMLRALMMSGDPDTGAVIDLGLLQPSSTGRAFLREEQLTLPGGLGAYHSLCVCSDWPDGQLLLWGSLDERRGQPLWALQESLKRYLTVPPSAPPVKKPPADSPQAPLIALPQGSPPARLPARMLPSLRFPEAWAELADYFTALPPFAPFEAPGWHFVQVRLPENAPGPWCAVGYHARGGTVQRVAYAVPCGEDDPLPQALTGYRRTPGRHGQWYFLKLLP
ncbi:MAG: hypothetical protein IKK21_09900 [Clostridia bacterium]|nr:hypothetical protein [Clostridia bacterium]